MGGSRRHLDLEVERQIERCGDQTGLFGSLREPSQRLAVRALNRHAEADTGEAEPAVVAGAGYTVRFDTEVLVGDILACGEARERDRETRRDGGDDEVLRAPQRGIGAAEDRRWSDLDSGLALDMCGDAAASG